MLGYIHIGLVYSVRSRSNQIRCQFWTVNQLGKTKFLSSFAILRVASSLSNLIWLPNHKFIIIIQVNALKSITFWFIHLSLFCRFYVFFLVCKFLLRFHILRQLILNGCLCVTGAWVCVHLGAYNGLVCVYVSTKGYRSFSFLCHFLAPVMHFSTSVGYTKYTAIILINWWRSMC